MRALVLAALVAASTVNAATITFTPAREVVSPAATIALRRIDSATDFNKPPVIERAIDLANATAIDLAPGHWSVQISGEGVWHAEQFFTVPNDTDVMLGVWPAATIRGTLVAKAQPATVLMQFESTSLGGPSSHEKACVVEGASFRCEVPRARLHLRVRAPGHIAQYFFDVKPPRDLGKLTLREGHSITGRVTLPRELRDRVSEVTIRAEGATPIVTKAEKNGTFHIDGVPPGDWTLRASHPESLFSLPVRISMRAGFDAALPAPLALERPRRIRVNVQPSLGPDGKPWRVEVDRRISRSRLDPLTQSNARVDGTWESGPLAPAEYVLTVNTSGGDAWHYENVVLGADDATITLALETRSVRGTVTVGRKPIAATLTFEGEHTQTKVTSADDGTFAIVLPSKADEWDVHIESDNPLLERTLKDVQVRDGEVSIDLPNVILRGEVVDEEGAPVPYAIVRVLKIEGHLIDPTANEGGTFAIAGLPPGPNELQALGSEYTESDPVPVDIPEEGEAAPVRLILRKPRFVRGRVMSPFGPVPNAEVIVRATDVAMPLAPVLTTDAAGGFLGRIPRNAREFDIFVAPPGFSYTMDHVVWRDSILYVRTDNTGGTIELHGGENVQLMHGGATTTARGILGTWSGSASSLPLMEPGPYTACSGTRCVSGVLPPHGTLTLDLSSTD